MVERCRRFRGIERSIVMRLLPTLPIALVVLAALSVTACKNLVIRPPGDVAGYYASPNGPGER
jgi:hypothetical protein